MSLKDVKMKQTIESAIVEQHKDLKRRKVKPQEIKFILEGNTKQRIVLIFDGLDEYKIGTNQYIDEAITKDSLPDCWIIVTSRETKELAMIRDYMDAEAEITGFDEERVKEYVTKFLGNRDRCDELLEVALKSKLINVEDQSENTISSIDNISQDSGIEDINFGSNDFTSSDLSKELDNEEDEEDGKQVKCLDLCLPRRLRRVWRRKKEEKGRIGKEEQEKMNLIPNLTELKCKEKRPETYNKRRKKKDYGLLCIPIFLHMICILFRRKVSLPRTTTGIMGVIVERCADWDEIRKTGRRRVKEMKDALIKLGKFVFTKLQQEDFKQIFDKVRGMTNFVDVISLSYYLR